MYLVRIDLEMQRPKIVQGWRTENYMRVGTALAYRSVSWYVLYHDHSIAIRIVSWPTRIVTIVTPLINTIILFMKKQLIWVLELRKSVHYWWSSILFSPECKELTSMLDPLLYRWGVPPVVIRCVHWTMQMWVLQTWIIAQGPDILMRCLNFFSWEECRCLFPGRSPRESAETAIWSLLNYFM